MPTPGRFNFTIPPLPKPYYETLRAAQASLGFKSQRTVVMLGLLALVKLRTLDPGEMKALAAQAAREGGEPGASMAST
jgi:hypothetical protein